MMKISIVTVVAKDHSRINLFNKFVLESFQGIWPHLFNLISNLIYARVFSVIKKMSINLFYRFSTRALFALSKL